MVHVDDLSVEHWSTDNPSVAGPLTGSSLVLAARSPFVRVGLGDAVREAGVVVLDEVAVADEAVAAVRRTRPDLLVLAADQGPAGLPATITAARLAAPDLEVLVLVDAEDDDLLEVVAAGAHGIVPAAVDPSRLPHILASMLAGEVAFSRRLTRRLAEDVERRRLRRLLRSQVDVAGGEPLTDREHEVLEALAAGRPTAAVAAELRISHATVRRHAANAMRKLGAPTRDDALRVVRERHAR